MGGIVFRFRFLIVRHALYAEAETGYRLAHEESVFLFGTIIGVLVALGLAAVVGVYFWAVRDLPGFTRIADYRPALTTTVLARDGSVIGSFTGKTVSSFRSIRCPRCSPKAFLAAEDAEFYEHEGVNPVAIFRAFLINLQSGTKRQGGSTITQQVIKRLLLTPERSYERKIKEAILAYRLEHYLSKDEILTIYLNQTFLGANAYGVEAAARTYFGKNAKDLTLAECASSRACPRLPPNITPTVTRVPPSVASTTYCAVCASLTGSRKPSTTPRSSSRWCSSKWRTAWAVRGMVSGRGAASAY